MEPQDTYDTRQAKQKASVKWLLSKAFNNKVPENLREPFYRDHENQEYLKPQIVGSLANAELYCLALGNIYSDPNYHNLNHGSILQTLARKGVLSEPSEIQLTETVLIQTNPLRMSAHMTVIESMMILYSKEVVTGDRVLAAIQRFNPTISLSESSIPQEHEQGLLLWVNHACTALKQRIVQEIEQSGSQESCRIHAPELPPIKDLNDLCDGVRLAALISFYCPDELPWNQLLISYLPTVSESLHNLMLVFDFCQHCLPYSVFHMMPEDVTYMKKCMKQNLIVFLADMFNVLEIHPVKCVRYPGIDKNTRVTRTPSTHLTLRKTHSLQSTPSEQTENSTPQKEGEDFVVHKGRVVPTLSSVLMVEEPLIPARLRPSKEKQNNDTKSDERGDGKQTAAGKPSNWDDKKTSYAGRRSRRNSVSEDSQLTIENFGGSQEHLNLIERNPDKDVAVHVGRKLAQITYEPIEATVPIRSSYQDARTTLNIGYDSDSEKQDREKEAVKLTRQLSSDAISLKNILHSKRTNNIINDSVDGEIVSKMLSFADISKQNMIGDHHKVQTVYMQEEQDENIKPSTSSLLNKMTLKPNNPEKKTTFAALPNTTTWQQQSSNLHQQQIDNNHTEDTGASHNLMSSQLNDIRMKLEEKRKHIENEKKKIEIVVSKQRQKVGKAAFLQAINKGKGSIAKSPSDSESSSAPSSEPRSPGSETFGKPMRTLTLQEISEDAMSMEMKWLRQQESGVPFVESRKTPETENLDLDHYHHSIEKMNSSLHDIQADIQRLAHQQTQIQATEVQSLIQQKQALDTHKLQQHLQNLQQHSTHYNQPYYNNVQNYMPVVHGHPPSSMQYSQMARGPRMPLEQQFYLHEQPQSQRRTWDLPTDVGGPAYHHPEVRTNKPLQSQGFMLHEPAEPHHPEMRYQNGEHSMHNTPVNYTLSQQHHEHKNASLMYSEPNTPHNASPQHRNVSVHRQISQLMNDGDDSNKHSFVNISQLGESFEKSRSSGVIHAPIPTPPVDDMEPQNISFIGNSDDNFAQGLKKLNISSGTRTYRIPSPTRPHISRSSFQQIQKPDNNFTVEIPAVETSSANEKGFYISFDNEQPKKPKPPLRTKRCSPKKDKIMTTGYSNNNNSSNNTSNDFISQSNQTERQEKIARERHKQFEREEEERRQIEEVKIERQRIEAVERQKIHEQTRQEKDSATTALVIGSELTGLDPSSVDEMERKKERILMMSLQRRQQQEEAKAKKEAEAHSRREREKFKEEERQRRKEEQAARRMAILEKHKLKKAIEEAEREGKVLDKTELMGGTLKSSTKMRNKGTTGRPRPKTIHVDSGSVEMAEGMLQPSQGKKGSTSNLSVNSYTPSTLRRDYYRGSQDSLADRRNGVGRLYKDIPDDNRGMSPCRTTNPSLGRRSSYITSREVQESGQARDRPKYPSIQTFKGRKSNSLMNLYGSSSDQDSMVYRYGDTDSGLGRATPPRRAPSPGMGHMRHLPSPSGPGSLPPGLMNKRRMFDDGSSDISSTPSSMMDYTGPRLYKQPTTKSNRSIMLNAVEYCVFPGVVNREAKQRVLDEISRSESKHFLILFRDAGCQFRALYSFCPDREEVLKLYGTGPKQVNDKMFDRFFKYNSGGKCFSQIHTKHLTVTIDAFTIHNSLWQGKKVNLPSKKDMALVI